jgi:hypothetical protein
MLVSLRPRFARDGRVRLPWGVSIYRKGGSDGQPGDVVGEHGGRDSDPFERTSDGLLLAEAFARFDLTRPRKAQAWYAEHGVVALGSVFPDDAVHPEELLDGEEVFHDTREEVLEQQRLVRWHLTSLARLTTHRDQAQPPDPSWRPHEGWEHRWAMAILPGSQVALWVGAPQGVYARITSEMQRYPRFEDVPGRRSLEDYDLDRFTAKQFVEEWWPRAHETWRRITEAGLPRLWVPSEGWTEYWDDYEVDGVAPHGRSRYGRISGDWHGLLELQRRLIEPYVRRAAAFEVDVDRKSRLVEPPTDGSPGVIEWDQALFVRERRRWRSILAPIYLQLLEGLRRVSEGSRGATWCRECGEPFLTLDARRSSFCTDRERLRHAQRERRKRLTGLRPTGPRGMPS